MNCITIDTTKYVGIDIGKRNCSVCVMDRDGNVLEHIKYKNTREAAGKLAKTVLSKYGTCSAVCESTSKMWMKTYEAFEEHKIPIILGNPIRMKMAQSGVKTDKLDAKKLADRLRMNAVPECYVYPKGTRRILDLMRHRITLVRDRTRVLNRQSSLCDRYDYELITGHGNTHNEKHQQFLEKLALNSHDTRIMMQHIRHVRYLNGEITTLEKSIYEVAYENKDAKIIMSIPGFGPFGALLVAASIDGIGRFDDPKKLVSFMGMCPRVYQSGESIKYGHMKKNVDGNLKWTMMQAAMIAEVHDPNLKSIYEDAKKSHPPKVARSIVGNKLAKYIWHMLTNGELYRYCDDKKYKQKLTRLKPKT